MRIGCIAKSGQKGAYVQLTSWLTLPLLPGAAVILLPQPGAAVEPLLGLDTPVIPFFIHLPPFLSPPPSSPSSFFFP